MATLKLYTQTRSKKKLTVPLYLRLFEGKALDLWVKLPVEVDPSTWSNKTGKFKKILKDPVSELRDSIEETERKLHKLETHVLKAVMSSTSRDKLWLQGVVDDFFNPARNPANTLKAYIQKFIDDAETGKKLTFVGSKRYSSATIKSIKSMQTEFDNYEAKLLEKIRNREAVSYRPKQFPINFDDINIDFYNDWVRYFNQKNYSPNTIGKHLKSLKTILRDAKENYLHSNTEYERRAFKITGSEVQNIYLNTEELKKIHELDLTNNPEYVPARDVFLIGCYTAQRFSDYHRINKIDILDDGSKVIKLTQQKTGAEVTIPVGRELMDILKRYMASDNQITLPRITEQHLNRQIKKVAEEAKINEPVEIKKTRGGLVSTTKYAKWQLVTSHTARRSGCSNLFNAGVAPQYIMKLSGHKTEREFLKYLKLTNDEVAKKLAKHDYFIGNNLKVAK